MSVEITTYKGTDKALTQGIEAGLLYTCIEIVKEAKPLSAFNEGRLRNSMMYKTSQTRGGFNDSSGEKAAEEINVNPKSLVAYVGSAMDYAPYVFFGTRNQAPQPAFRPAIALVMGKDRKEVARKIEEETNRGKLYEGRKMETFK